jgi:transposase
MVLYVGGDLSRKRLDWLALWADGQVCGGGAVPPDREGLARFAEQLVGFAGEVVCVIESMTGARFVHDELERRGVEVRIADARKAKLAAELLGKGGAKTDQLDARLLAELGRRELVPEIWLPDVATREARDRQVPAPPGAPPDVVEEPDPPDADHARGVRAGVRPVRRRRPSALGGTVVA